MVVDDTQGPVEVKRALYSLSLPWFPVFPQPRPPVQLVAFNYHSALCPSTPLTPLSSPRSLSPPPLRHNCWSCNAKQGIAPTSCMGREGSGKEQCSREDRVRGVLGQKSRDPDGLGPGAWTGPRLCGVLSRQSIRSKVDTQGRHLAQMGAQESLPNSWSNRRRGVWPHSCIVPREREIAGACSPGEENSRDKRRTR